MGEVVRGLKNQRGENYRCNDYRGKTSLGGTVEELNVHGLKCTKGWLLRVDLFEWLIVHGVTCLFVKYAWVKCTHQKCPWGEMYPVKCPGVICLWGELPKW